MAKNKVGIVDYDAGNLRSVINAVRKAGGDPVVSALPEVLSSCDRVILPGVGEASTAMGKLRERGLDSFIPTLRVPVLGICIGLQLMSLRSDEGDATCMGIFPSEVKRITDLKGEESTEKVKIPHMGWNSIFPVKESWGTPLLEGIQGGSYVYYVHSFAATLSSSTAAVTSYGGHDFSAVLCKDNFLGCQFHPEKSGPTGEAILRNFLSL